MSVDPILREDSPETQFKKMIKACICLALYILQSFSTYFISYDYQETEKLSGLHKVTLLISYRVNWKLNPAFDSQSGALSTGHSRLVCLLTLAF